MVSTISSLSSLKIGLKQLYLESFLKTVAEGNSRRHIPTSDQSLQSIFLIYEQLYGSYETNYRCRIIRIQDGLFLMFVDNWALS